MVRRFIYLFIITLLIQALLSQSMRSVTTYHGKAILVDKSTNTIPCNILIVVIIVISNWLKSRRRGEGCSRREDSSSCTSEAASYRLKKCRSRTARCRSISDCTALVLPHSAAPTRATPCLSKSNCGSKKGINLEKNMTSKLNQMVSRKKKYKIITR